MNTRQPAIIGLVFTHNLAFCRRVLRGIRDFAESRPHWVLIPIDAEPRAIRTLAELSPAGLIGHLFTRPVLDRSSFGFRVRTYWSVRMRSRWE